MLLLLVLGVLMVYEALEKPFKWVYFLKISPVQGFKFKTNLLFDRHIESNSCLSFWKFASSLVQPRIRGVLETKKHDLLCPVWILRCCLALGLWNCQRYHLVSADRTFSVFAWVCSWENRCPWGPTVTFYQQKPDPGVELAYRQGFHLRGILWQLAVSVVSLIFFEP